MTKTADHLVDEFIALMPEIDEPGTHYQATVGDMIVYLEVNEEHNAHAFELLDDSPEQWHIVVRWPHTGEVELTLNYTEEQALAKLQTALDLYRKGEYTDG